MCKALGRRVKAGELLKVFPRLYALTEVWENLSPPERSLYMARGYASLNPDKAFAEITAAAAHGFDHQWSLHDGSPTIAGTQHGRYRAHAKLHYLYVPVTGPYIPITAITFLVSGSAGQATGE